MARFHFIVITCLLSLLCAEVHAGKNERSAKRLFIKAQRQYKRQQFEDALQKYQAALRLHSRPSIIFNIAQCYRKLGRDEDALSTYRLFLSEWKQTHRNKEPPNVRLVHEHIVELTARVEARRKRTGLLVLHNVPDNATIAIDGKPYGKGPPKQSPTLIVGEHDVRVDAPGFIRWTKTITIQPGKVTAEWVLLQPAASQPAASQPAASQPAASQPAASQPTSHPTEKETTEDSSSTRTVWLVAGCGTAAAAVASAAVGIAFQGKTNDAAGATDQNAYDRNKAISITGYVLAGTFAAATAVSFYLYYRHKKKRSVAILPTSGGASMAATLRF